MTTANDNTDERRAALAASYMDEANWNAIPGDDDGDEPTFGLAYDRYRLAVYGVPGGNGRGWTIEPGDDWKRPCSDRGWPTAAEAKADAFRPLAEKGTSEAQIEAKYAASGREPSVDQMRNALVDAMRDALESARTIEDDCGQRCEAALRLVPGDVEEEKARNGLRVRIADRVCGELLPFRRLMPPGEEIRVTLILTADRAQYNLADDEGLAMATILRFPIDAAKRAEIAAMMEAGPCGYADENGVRERRRARGSPVHDAATAGPRHD